MKLKTKYPNCPNCGANDYDYIIDGTLCCTFCGSEFVDEEENYEIQIDSTASVYLHKEVELKRALVVPSGLKMVADSLDLDCEHLKI